MGLVSFVAFTYFVAAFFTHVHIGSATYSCCSKERRGTVCTLAGSGAADSIDSPNATTAAIYEPTGVSLYPPSSIIVTGYNEHRLRIIHQNGSVSTLAGGGPLGEYSGSYVDSNDPLAARFWRPYSVCTDNNGNVLASDAWNHRIRIILCNGSVRTLAGSGETGLEKGGYADSADPLQAKFLHPHGIASIVENGQRLTIIGGNYDHRVRVIYANTTVSTLAGSGLTGLMQCNSADSADPLAACFCHPECAVQDYQGNIIVAELYGNRIRKVWRDGSHSGVTTIAGRGPCSNSDGSSTDSDIPAEASFFTPVGLAIDGVGDILVSATCEHRVRIIFVNGSVRTLAGSGPSTGHFNANSPGAFLDNVPLLQARFNSPHFLAMDREGNAILADVSNNRIRMLCVGQPVTIASSSSESNTVALKAVDSASLSSTVTPTSSLMASRSPSIVTASTLTATKTRAAAGTPSLPRTATPTVRGPVLDPPVLEAQKGVTLGTTVAALVAATATDGGVELQGAIVLGTMDCSSAYVRKVSDGSSRFVTLLYDQSAALRVLGNLLIAVAALVVHCGAVVAVRLHGGCSTIGEAAAKCRFPGLSHRIFVLCFQGLLLESLRGVVRHSDDTSALGVSVCGLVVCVCVPALVAVQCASASREVAYSPYVVALTKYPRWLRGLLLPRGWWSPRDDARSSLGLAVLLHGWAVPIDVVLPAAVRSSCGDERCCCCDGGAVHWADGLPRVRARPPCCWCVVSAAAPRGVGWVRQRHDGRPGCVHDCDDTCARVRGDVARHPLGAQRDGHRHFFGCCGTSCLECSGAPLGAPRGECVCCSRRAERPPSGCG